MCSHTHVCYIHIKFFGGNFAKWSHSDFICAGKCHESKLMFAFIKSMYQFYYLKNRNNSTVAFLEML